MTWQQEFWSWMTPSYVKTAEPPAVGEKAPTAPKLTVPKDGKPTIIAFLRHCGCPCRPSQTTWLIARTLLTTSSRREDVPEPAQRSCCEPQRSVHRRLTQRPRLDRPLACRSARCIQEHPTQPTSRRRRRTRSVRRIRPRHFELLPRSLACWFEQCEQVGQGGGHLEPAH